jgi:hypothetical protein
LLLLGAEGPDAEFVIHALAAPAGGGGIAVDVKALGGVRLLKRGPFVARCGFAVEDLELPSIGPSKPPAAVRAGLGTVRRFDPSAWRHRTYPGKLLLYTVL